MARSLAKVIEREVLIGSVGNEKLCFLKIFFLSWGYYENSNKNTRYSHTAIAV